MSANGVGISIIVEFQVSEQNKPLLLERLKKSCRETLADDGCYYMYISEPMDKEGTIFLTEYWRDQMSIDRHRLKPGHDEEHEITDRLVSAKRVSKCLVVRNV